MELQITACPKRARPRSKGSRAQRHTRKEERTGEKGRGRGDTGGSRGQTPRTCCVPLCLLRPWRSRLSSSAATSHSIDAAPRDAGREPARGAGTQHRRKTRGRKGGGAWREERVAPLLFCAASAALTCACHCPSRVRCSASSSRASPHRLAGGKYKQAKQLLHGTGHAQHARCPSRPPSLRPAFLPSFCRLCGLLRSAFP